MNKKSVSVPRPQPVDGWIRKSDLDAWLDRSLPVPTRVISNEEYDPIPQTGQQKRVEEQIVGEAERISKRLGLDRRQFLRTSCGTALAFAAMNSVFGPLFRVEAEELTEAAAAGGKTRYFIFDVQTHHVAMPWQAPQADKDFLDAVVGMRGMASKMNPALKEHTPKIEDAYLENYIKEVFLDSETDVVALSALPSDKEQTDVLTPEVIGKSRGWITELTRSARVISHGYFSPDLGSRNLEYMQGQQEKLKIDAWKGYTGVARAEGKQGWRMDDEKNSYPALEYARKKGVRNICLHKGLPFPGDPEWWSPMDVCKAAKDFPDLNFLVYHSGFRSLQQSLPKVGDGFAKDAHIPWVSDFCAWKKKNPDVKNIYMEMGSTFALMVSANPLLAAHVLGMIIDAFGEDHLLWGTDSIWWGSPQWQIEAFRRLEMPATLQKRFGYKPLTEEVKRKVFGLNAAKVYGIDPATKVNPVPGDYVERLRKMYKQAAAPSPSHTQYGWVRASSVAGY